MTLTYTLPVSNQISLSGHRTAARCVSKTLFPAFLSSCLPPTEKSTQNTFFLEPTQSVGPTAANTSGLVDA